MSVLRQCGLADADTIPERNAHADRRSGSNRAADADRSAMQFDKLLHQRETDACTFERATLRPFDAVEALENVRKLST